MSHTRSVTCNHLLWGLAGAAALASGPASSAEWLLRIGAHSVDPKSDNHPVVSVDSGTSLTFDLTYMYSERFGVEVLAALPFEHDITLNADGSKVGETKHLPPTVSAQYHFSPGGSIHPYVGVGVNLTRFSSESTTGALSGVDLKLKTSSGLAVQVGADFDVSDDWVVNVVARWMDIDSKVELDGASIGTVKIDPLVLGVSVGRRFGNR